MASPVHRLLQHQLLNNEHIQDLLRQEQTQREGHHNKLSISQPPVPPAWGDLEAISRALWTNTPGYQPASRYTSVTTSHVGAFDDAEMQFLQVRLFGSPVPLSMCGVRRMGPAPPSTTAAGTSLPPLLSTRCVYRTSRSEPNHTKNT